MSILLLFITIPPPIIKTFSINTHISISNVLVLVVPIAILYLNFAIIFYYSYPATTVIYATPTASTTCSITLLKSAVTATVL